MFGKKKQPPIRSLVGEGTVVVGELRFTEGLRIDGEVQGDVVAIGTATASS
jgi:cytoskeletal protein CcmA (bactofilin family)